jgi:hypothetical protein
MNLNNEQQRVPFDVNSLPWIECSCGGKIFDSGVMVKRVSALLSPTGKEEILPAEIIICKTCGKIPDFYAKNIPGIPSELISGPQLNSL